MFTGSSTVRTFVIPHVCGTAGQRYFLGKHGQNKTKQKKSQGSPSAWPWCFLGPIIQFSVWIYFFLSSCLFAVGSILNFSLPAPHFTHFIHISDLMHDFCMNRNFLSPQYLMLTVIQSAILMWIITSPSAGHSPRLIIGFACLSLTFRYTSCFRIHWKHLLCLPQRPPSPPCADVLGASCGFTFPRLPPRRRGLSVVSPVPQENHAADSHLTHLSQQTGHSRVWPVSRGRAGFNGGSPAGACSSRTSCCRPLRSTWRKRSRCGKRS